MQQPHRRFNALTGEWVLVSPHRAKRPWQGQQEEIIKEKRPAYDASCYLCPGNTRVSGDVNPDYAQTYVFQNDHAALLSDPQLSQEENEHELLRSASVSGTCQVVCFSPRHDLSLADMSTSELIAVIERLGTAVAELGERYCWVQAFENKGAMMGCSMPHPHGQIWALDALPNEAVKEQQQQQSYFQQHGEPLLLAYAMLESQQKERVVAENDDWIVVVPYWAVWPFETLLLPKFAVQYLHQLTSSQQQTLAEITQQLLRTYDGLFNVSFPYSMGWHGAPFGEMDASWQLHAHYYPPLLRSATVRKFMVGFEMLAEAQRDLTPEQAALRLREVV